MDSTSYGKAVDVNPIETALRTSIGSFSWSAYFAYAVGMMTGISPTGEIPRHSFHEEYPTWQFRKEDANLPFPSLPFSKAHKTAKRYSYYHIFSDSIIIPPEEWVPIDTLLTVSILLLSGVNSARTKARSLDTFSRAGEKVSFVPRCVGYPLL